MYRLTNGPTIIRLADNASIPPDPANRDYVGYLAWVALGNEPQAADVVPIQYTGERVLTEQVVTSGTDPEELFRISLPTQTAHMADIQVVGIDSGNGNVRYIRASMVVKRLNNGAIIVPITGGGLAGVMADHRDGTAGTWLIVPSVSGSDFLVTVTGAASRTITWSFRALVRSFAPNGFS